MRIPGQRLRVPAYRLYQRRLRRNLERGPLPKHIAMILDGNRRWARLAGLGSVAHGHRAGADKFLEFAGWVDDLHIPVVTFYLLSTDNLAGRDDEELTALFQIIGDLALELSDRWRVHTPCDHVLEFQQLWIARPRDEWVHAFIHTLDEMPRFCYTPIELHQEIATWGELTVRFTHTFTFADANPDVNNALQLIHNVVLQVVLVAYPVDPHTSCQMQSLMECFNITDGPEDDDDPRNVTIPYSEGSSDVVPPVVPSNPFSQPL